MILEHPHSLGIIRKLTRLLPHGGLLADYRSRVAEGAPAAIDFIVRYTAMSPSNRLPADALDADFQREAAAQRPSPTDEG